MDLVSPQCHLSYVPPMITCHVYGYFEIQSQHKLITTFSLDFYICCTIMVFLYPVMIEQISGSYKTTV